MNANNSSISTYHRLIKSSIAEQILETSKIHINLETLRPHLIGDRVSKNSEVYKYMKNASQGGGYVSTKYHSKDIITARMFTCKNHLNIINLSDPIVLSSMNSRYQNGVMVVLDYKTYEPTIIRNILGDVFPSDFHTWASDTLKLDRKECKAINMELLYCSSFDDKMIEVASNMLKKYNLNIDNITKYAETMKQIRSTIEEYIKPMVKSYEKSGYIVNQYGRKIYPKESRNIFSNMIQSVGSEIIIEAIINLNGFLVGKNAHLLFHRFDALYFDFSRKEFLQNINEVVKIMESSGGEIQQLKVGVQLGNSLNSLKDIQIV